jgi:hypothetical protein
MTCSNLYVVRRLHDLQEFLSSHGHEKSTVEGSYYPNQFEIQEVQDSQRFMSNPERWPIMPHEMKGSHPEVDSGRWSAYGIMLGAFAPLLQFHIYSATDPKTSIYIMPDEDTELLTITTHTVTYAIFSQCSGVGLRRRSIRTWRPT